MMSEARINKRILDLKPYSVPELEEGEIKLDAQENPYPLDLSIMEELCEDICKTELNRYPDPNCTELKNEIAKYCNLDPENILVGNGSDELIQTIYIASGGKDKSAVAPSPTFSMYSILAQVTGTRFSDIPMSDDFILPVQKLLAIRPDIVFITYPNNPTGNCFSEDGILRIIENSKGLVIIDEAYYEFSKKTFVDKINKYDNLIVLRTFSKAFSLAGIRAGYLLSNRDIINQYRKVQLPYNMSVVNQNIVASVLKNREAILKTVEKIISSRDNLYEKLLKIEDIKAFKSEANYILMKIKNIDKVISVLRSNNIRIREFSDEMLKEYLRVTVGTDKENDSFINALIKACNGG